MATILFSDIHLNSNPQDDYRWGLLPWIHNITRQRNIDQVILLGDATDSKDKHNSVLVNKIVDQITLLSKHSRVILLCGNHDFVDPDWPFFKFVTAIKDTLFIYKPTELKLNISLNESSCLFLPSTKNYKEAWKDLDFNDYKYIFCHQTFQGILGESGFPLPGIPTNIFDGTTAKIYSGDIHTPQKIGPVEYVGAPYRTNFGDTYTPRVVYVDDNGRASDLHYPCPSKHTVVIRNLNDLDQYKDIKKDDFVKIKVKLKRHEYSDWPELRRQLLEAAADKGWRATVELSELLAARPRLQLQSSTHKTPADLVRAFAAAQRLEPELMEIGLKLIGG